ncbi:MAG: hypothetical protein QOI47_842, partial [Actinomycetota bacterium]|nr:hypothetical protein [Actinomycetota bacterium]
MTMTKFRRPTAAIRQALGVLGVVAIASGAVLGLTVATSGAVPQPPPPNGFAPEPSNSYSGPAASLSPNCPNAIASTNG